MIYKYINIFLFCTIFINPALKYFHILCLHSTSPIPRSGGIRYVIVVVVKKRYDFAIVSKA